MGFAFNPGDVHVESTLAQISVRFNNEATIWDKVLPLVPVGKLSDKYTVWNTETAFNQTEDLITPVGDANEISMELSQDNYSCVERALAAWVPVTAIENADDPIRPEADAVINIREQLDNNQEVRAAAAAFVAAAYPAGNKETLATSARWSDSSSTPLDDIDDAKDSMLVMPNTLVLGAQTWKYLKRHPDVLAAVYPMGGNAATGGRVASLQALADLLELDQVLVGRRRVNTAAPGATPAYSRAWGAHALLAYVSPRPAINQVSLGYTFSDSQTNIVRELDMKKGSRGAVYVKDGWTEDAKITAATAGYFFENAGDDS